MTTSQSPAAVVAVPVLLSCLALVAVALRFNLRRSKKVPLQADDWSVLAGMVQMRAGSLSWTTEN